MIVEHRDFLDEHWVKVFLETFEYSVDSVVMTTTSPQEHFLYVNEVFKKKTGYSESDLVGESPRILQGPQTNREVINKLKKKLQNGENFIGQTTNYRKDGTSYIVRWYISALKDPEGKTIAYVSYQKEVTQSIWDHNQVKLLSSIVNQINQMVSVTDLNGDIVYVNQNFLKKYGYPEEYVLHRSIKFLNSGKNSQSFYKDLWEIILHDKSFHGIFFNKHKSGQIIVEQKTITPIKNESGDTHFFVSIGQDITDLMNESDTYKQKAYVDSLTGLYNRMKFDEVMQRKFQEHDGTQTTFSIIILDIDDFKNINDTFGHDAGDKILKKLAFIIQKELRKDDFIVRWGGEEFVVIVDDDLEKTTAIAQKLRLVVNNSLYVESTQVTISLGVTEVRENDEYKSFFKRVDRALYQSKQNGKNRVTSL